MFSNLLKRIVQGAAVIALAGLMGCASSSSSVKYTDDYARTTDANKATYQTQEALATDDVVKTLSEMMGTPDQNTVVTASNVQFITNLDELNERVYDRYTLRIADNISYGPRGIHKDSFGYSKDSGSSVRLMLEEIQYEHPNAVIALNKQDRIIAVALDQLEAQALAQLSPRVFYVLQGQTLKETVSRWSRQANWHTQWLIDKDYTMVAPATIFGEFSAQNGSLDQLLSTLRYLDQPLKAQFTRNKLVVIRDNQYDSNIMAVMP